MKKNLFGSLLLAVMILFSGCTIDGTISDVNSTAIKNAKVVATFNGQTQEVLSDDEGHYSISDVEVGDEVALHVSKSGYISQDASLGYSKENVTKNFVLEADKIIIVGAKGLVQSEANAEASSNIYVNILNQSTTTSTNDGSFTSNDPIPYESININMPLVVEVHVVNADEAEYTFTQTIIPSEHLVEASGSTGGYYIDFPTIILDDDVVDACSVPSGRDDTVVSSGGFVPAVRTTNTTIGTICPAIYAPVCGAVEVQCITTPCEKVEQTFSNQCVLDANKKATFLYAGECQKTVAPPVTICTMDYTPVCASVEVECITAPCEKVEQTFSNMCHMEANKKATFLYPGECQKTVAPPEEPIKVCPLNANPVCGLVRTVCNETTCDAKAETFSNMCFLNMSENTTFLYGGECKEVKPPISKEPIDCPTVYETKICPAIYAPVCADINGERKTFASKCVMRATKEAKFLFAGECVGGIEPQ